MVPPPNIATPVCTPVLIQPVVCSGWRSRYHLECPSQSARICISVKRRCALTQYSRSWFGSLVFLPELVFGLILMG